MVAKKTKWVLTHIHKLDLSFTKSGSSYANCWSHFINVTTWYDSIDDAFSHSVEGDTIKKVEIIEELSVEAAPTKTLKRI